jgi:Secretion system C-terminal sorting domain
MNRLVISLLALAVSCSGVASFGQSVANERANNGGTSNEWLVYPNPVVNVVSINIPQTAVGTVYVDIIDRKGKTDHIATEGRSDSKLQLDMSIYAPGQYIISVCSVDLGVSRIVVLKK